MKWVVSNVVVVGKFFLALKKKMERGVNNGCWFSLTFSLARLPFLHSKHSKRETYNTAKAQRDTHAHTMLAAVVSAKTKTKTQ